MENEENKKVVIDVDVSDIHDRPKPNVPPIKKLSFWHKILLLISQCQLLITVILYIVLSLTIPGTYGPYKLNGWGFWWILFLLVPTIPQVIFSLRRGNLQFLPVFNIVLVSYLTIGLTTGLWHPYWALFFIVPVYHSLMFKINAIFFTDKIRDHHNID